MGAGDGVGVGVGAGVGVGVGDGDGDGVFAEEEKDAISFRIWSAIASPSAQVANAIPPPTIASSIAYSDADAPLQSRIIFEYRFAAFPMLLSPQKPHRAEHAPLAE